MFRLFSFQKAPPEEALAHYKAAVARVRNPAYYGEFGVPDSFDGRFDMLLVQLFPVIHACVKANEPEFAQAIFDITFHHIDQTLRECGIGDMGVPKHMKRMMKAFNGRMNAYEAGWQAQDLEGALARNLYGTLENPPEEQVRMMAAHFAAMIKSAEEIDFAKIKAGQDVTLNVQEHKQYGT